MKKKKNFLVVVLVLAIALTTMAHQSSCRGTETAVSSAGDSVCADNSKPAYEPGSEGSTEVKSDAKAETRTDAKAILNITYQKADSLKVESLLAESKKRDTTTNFMLFFARKLLGIPYVGHTLEVNAEEQLVVNLRQLDCTTYVETVCALTLCAKHGQTAFADYCHWLGQLRYRGGQLTDYTSRLHYFTDWIEDNTRMGFVKETQQKTAPFNAVQTVKVGFMTEHPQYYDMLKDNQQFQSVIAQQEKALNGRQYRYIVKTDISKTPAMRQAVADGDIIAILTNKKGLDTSHVGIAVWHADGLHLLNASQIHKKTVEEPMTLRQYMGKHPTQTGIRVVKLL